MIKMELWGKDHWSTLAYVECCCEDGSQNGYGTLVNARMKTNPETHPLLVGHYATQSNWNTKCGTRLKGVSILEEHDDWDCLDDMEAEGLVEIVSLVNGFVKLTAKGIEVAHALRRYKINGGNFAGFEYKENE